MLMLLLWPAIASMLTAAWSCRQYPSTACTAGIAALRYDLLRLIFCAAAPVHVSTQSIHFASCGMQVCCAHPGTSWGLRVLTADDQCGYSSATTTVTLWNCSSTDSAASMSRTDPGLSMSVKSFCPVLHSKHCPALLPNKPQVLASPQTFSIFSL